jgi:glycosyltransferase
MKISLVTAVYNRVNTVGDALASVQGQSQSAAEHLIQDGGSTDGTLDVIRAQRTAETRLVSEPDTGIYDAINKGISRATGEVIGLMHSDDIFAHARVLEKVAEVLENEDIAGVYGDLDYVSAEDPSKVIRRWRSGHYCRSKLRRGWMPPHPTLYLRREVFETWGLYDPDFQISADYDAILRFLWKGRVRIAYLPEVLVKMRVGGESNRSLGRIYQKSLEDYRAIKSNGVGGVETLAMKNLSKIRQYF